MNEVGRLVTDHHGRILETSPESATLLAVKDRWIAGKPLASFVAEPDRRRFRTLLRSVVRQSQTGRGEFTLRRRDETLFEATIDAHANAETVSWTLWTEAAPAAAAGDDGESEEIHDNDRDFARLLARLPVGVLVVSEGLLVEYVNPAARRFFPRDSLREGDTLPECWPNFSLHDHARSLFGRRPATAERLVRLDEKRIIAVEGIPAAGASTGIFLIQEVTARERQRRAERDFVANAAHELRTPLAAIRGAVEALQHGAKESVEDRDRFLAHIEDASIQLGRLVRSFLVLARIQSGQQQPRLELVEVEPLLREIAEELEPAPDVELCLEAAPEVGVLADRALARQALWNLAHNAAKYTREGEIVIRARDLGTVTEIQITDTGPGMTERDRARALDRFYRPSGAQPQGFGLGVTIADEVVKALSGRLMLDSAEGVGTRVSVQLPSARITRP